MSLLSSKIVINEEEPSIRSIPALATAVLGMVAVTQRGPFGSTLVTSWEEFKRYFGGDVANSLGVHAVRGFFQNEGQFLYLERAVHYTDPTNPATKTSAKATYTIQTGAFAPTSATVIGTVAAPWNLEPGDTLIVIVDRNGAPPTTTFNATAASRQNGVDEVFALVDGQTLTVAIDGGGVQTIAFLTAEFVDIANATAEEVAAVIAAKITGAQVSVTGAGKRVTITSDTRGTDSGVNITGGTANAALQFTTGNVAGTGNVGNIEAVELSEVKAAVELATAGCTVSDDGTGKCKIISNTTGTGSYIQVSAASTADDELGLVNAEYQGAAGTAVDTLRVDGKYDGTYAHALRARVAAATSGVASEFNFSIEEDGVTVETFPNVTMDDAQTNYVETVVNNTDTGSNLVSVTDLDATVAPNYGRPANGLNGPLASGNDGLAGIVDADYVGSQAGHTGIYAFDLAEDMTLLAIPDRATAAVQQAMYAYSETERERAVFCIFDSPAGLSATQAVTYFVTTAALYQATECGAAYWPRIKVLNPNKTIYGSDASLVVPPSGHIAGMFARGDKAQGGVYLPPAGVENGKLLGCTGVETTEALDVRKRDLVFPKNINPITTFNGAGGYFVDGARCCKDNGNFPTVGERRGVSHIEQSIKRGIEWARHKPNDRKLRQRISRTVNSFLLVQMKDGAFRSTDPSTAFFVDFGDGLNPPSVQFARQVRGRVGLATQKPAEFIILNFAQDTRALDEELLSAGLG